MESKIIYDERKNNKHITIANCHNVNNNNKNNQVQNTRKNLVEIIRKFDHQRIQNQTT